MYSDKPLKYTRLIRSFRHIVEKTLDFYDAHGKQPCHVALLATLDGSVTAGGISRVFADGGLGLYIALFKKNTKPISSPISRVPDTTFGCTPHPPPISTSYRGSSSQSGSSASPRHLAFLRRRHRRLHELAADPPASSPRRRAAPDLQRPLADASSTTSIQPTDASSTTSTPAAPPPPRRRPCPHHLDGGDTIYPTVGELFHFSFFPIT